MSESPRSRDPPSSMLTPDSSRNLITIDGFMSMCQELDIDPESDSVLFCLAADLGSKALGEFAKEPFVSGWLEIDSR